MKRFTKIITLFVILTIISGCAPKTPVYKTAEDTLKRIEATCNEIADDVEKLDDEYTSGVFQNILDETLNYRMLLESKPNTATIEAASISLARIEKELGSIKVLAGGMGDYTPELSFQFTNNTDKIVSKIDLESQNGETINAFSGEIAPGANVIITYPVEDGTWKITAVLDNNDEITGENITLSTINGLTLNSADGNYEYTIN